MFTLFGDEAVPPLLDDSEISKNLGINLPTGDIPTLELELETSAKDTFF